MTVPNTFQNQTGPLPLSQLDANFAALGLSGNVSFTSSGTGAVSRTVSSKLQEVLSVKDFGAVGNGSTDDYTAISTANTAASSLGASLRFPPGTYKVGSNLSITVPIIVEGILQPANAIKITISSGSVQAGLYQIFDKSAGGTVEFFATGGGGQEVFVEWWGANNTRTDNQIPIQQALDAVQLQDVAPYTTPSGQISAGTVTNNGCVVRLGKNTAYLTSGHIIMANNVILRGLGQYSGLVANSGTWGTDAEMVLFQNGTSAQFGCRLENMRLKANYIAAITRVIYAPAWQQNCGPRDVWITDFASKGIQLDTGYGGSVGVCLRDVNFINVIANASNAYQCVAADFSTYSTGWFQLMIENCTFESDKTNLTGIVSQTGVYAKGRVMVDVRNFHVEGMAYGVQLDTAASLRGTTISAGGNASVSAVINTTAAWTGNIDVSGARKGGATNLLLSSAGGATLLYANEPIWGRVVYPHTPSETLALARSTNGAVPVLDSTSYGFTGVTRLGAGNYKLTFDTTKFNPANGSTTYRYRLFMQDTPQLIGYVSAATATDITVQFKNVSNVATDCADFALEMYGRPGI